jgi:hypothetical protein
MAFDMYFGTRHEKIDTYEEHIFQLVLAAPERFPQLDSIGDRFYSDFSLSPEQANAVIHELLLLLEEQGENPEKSLSLLIFRLVQFFSAACRANQDIRCAGD